MITRGEREGEISNCTAGADLTQAFTKMDLVTKYYRGWGENYLEKLVVNIKSGYEILSGVEWEGY